MICVTCGCDIPPAFVHAIASNICAGCAGPIMSDESKNLMDELKAQLLLMPNDPEGLAGWILSTYDIFPKGTVQATPFHRKKGKRMIEVDDEDIAVDQDGRPLKIAKTPSQQAIMKRAGVDKLDQDPKRAALKKAAQMMNSSDENMYGFDEEDEDQGISVEDEDETQNHSMLQMIAKAKAKNNGRKKTAASALTNMANFSMPGMNNSEMSEYDLQRIQQMVGGSNEYNSGDPDLDGLDSLPPALQSDRLARLQKQRELSYGGSVGSIKRSS